MRTFKFNKKHIPALILAAVCLVVAVLCIVKAVDDIKYHEELTQSSIIDITQTILTADGGNGKKVPVVGVDATEAAKDLIKSGKMTGTIKQDAVGMAEALITLCENGLSGSAALMDNTSMYNVDARVNKIRIPYSKYLGENAE